MQISTSNVLLAALLLSLTVISLIRTPGNANATPVRGASLTSELRKELLAVRESVWRAWFENDQSALAKLLPQDLIAINFAQVEWDDREKTLTGAKEFARQGGRLLGLDFPKTDIQLYDNVAILYSQFEVEMSTGGSTQKQSGRATEIFVRQNGHWVNSGWHLDSGK
jgi:ketosteroid isomerase-like protein